MLDSLIDPLLERCRPHAITMRDYMLMWTTGVIERLDRIAEAVSDDTTFTVRREFHGTGASGPVTRTVEVPSNEEWTLEAVAARSLPAAAGTFDIYDQQGQLRAAFDIPATGALTGVFEPLHFHGGAILNATLSVPGQWHLVFRHERIMPSRLAINGFRNPPTTELPTDEMMLEKRHSGVFSGHIPITGPHSPDAATGVPPQDD